MHLFNASLILHSMPATEQLYGIDLKEILKDKALALWDAKIVLKPVKPFNEKKALAFNGVKFSRELLRKEWPANQGSFVVRDPASPVAFCCPGQDKELQDYAILQGAAISGPCMTPDIGIELLVSNLISNPNIRFLVLAGNDSGHLAGDAVYCLNKFGVDEKTSRIKNAKCPTNPFITNLPLDAIKRFQKQIQVIDLLGCRDKKAISLVIRSCLQEKDAAVKLFNQKRNEELLLFDKGSEGFEPMKIKLGFSEIKKELIALKNSIAARIGSSIKAETVDDAFKQLQALILEHGSPGFQESSRFALDVVATQIVFEKPLLSIPENWKPHGWMKNSEQAKEFLEKYSVWVYLFPFSDVRFNEKKKAIEPYVPEKMDYAYGTRLTAYGIEFASNEEKESVLGLVREMHERFKDKTPGHEEIIRFYERLELFQEKSFNQLFKTAKAAKYCVEKGVSSSYRLYVSLQIPLIDVKENPLQAHNPCFCLYEVYPRKIKKSWQLDCCMFLRANDLLAFPANANAGFRIQKFLADFAGMPQGTLVYHAGSLHLCDYMLDKETVNKFLKEMA